MSKFSPFATTLWYATAAPAPRRRRSKAASAPMSASSAPASPASPPPWSSPGEVKVVLLEAEEAGFGGSGRNAGHCTPTFSYYSLPSLRKILGEPWAERLIHRQTRANDRVGAMIRDYQIDCEWRQNGYVMGALRPGAIEVLKAKVEQYNDVGARTRLLGRDEVEALTGSPRFYGGWFHEEAGHMNPLGYARGLARAVMQEGGTLYTASPAEDVEPEGLRWKVRTPHGEVIADKVIFATGAYTVKAWPKLDRSFKILQGLRLRHPAARPGCAQIRAAAGHHDA